MYQPYCVIKVAKSPVDEDLKWMLKEPWHCIRATSIRTAYGTTFEVNETDVDLWRPPPVSHWGQQSRDVPRQCEDQDLHQDQLCRGGCRGEDWPIVPPQLFGNSVGDG